MAAIVMILAVTVPFQQSRNYELQYATAILSFCFPIALIYWRYGILCPKCGTSVGYMSQRPFSLTLQIPMFVRCPNCAVDFDDMAEDNEAGETTTD